MKVLGLVSRATGPRARVVRPGRGGGVYESHALAATPARTRTREDDREAEAEAEASYVAGFPVPLPLPPGPMLVCVDALVFTQVTRARFVAACAS